MITPAITVPITIPAIVPAGRLLAVCFSSEPMGVIGLVGEGFQGIERGELKELETLDDCSAEVEVESCVVTVTVSGDLLPESGSQYLLSFRR